VSVLFIHSLILFFSPVVAINNVILFVKIKEVFEICAKLSFSHFKKLLVDGSFDAFVECQKADFDVKICGRVDFWHRCESRHRRCDFSSAFCLFTGLSKFFWSLV